MKKIVILGSTGSIGRNGLKVIKHLGADYRVLGLAANSNVKLLLEQVYNFRPKFVSIFDYKYHKELKRSLPRSIKLLPPGIDGLVELSSMPEADIALNALSGAVGFAPLLASIRTSKQIALANKEPMVMAGRAVMKEAFRWRARIIPVDSEPSAVFQCLQTLGTAGYNDRVSEIFLTASGGPFYRRADLKNVTPLEALKHPNWKMGPKITIDSATLMNKGLEAIEIMNFFSLPVAKIRVLIHPQSVIHSAVKLNDGSVLAQMSLPDMKIPIQYALTYPDRVKSFAGPLDLARLGSLEFAEPDFKKFPCLPLAFYAAEKGGVYPCILNAANEVAVESFLGGRISFMRIPAITGRVMELYNGKNYEPALSEIAELDDWARNKAREEAIRIRKRKVKFEY
ncbi:MAG: 1-deoxy-D-xylulose-5-phosphate reductoisomerase [Elusimicrobia bacterium]|nr:1-deoxy-D-xylulose-5-phosphate reductoisomerase [Elusimicrobiota bacterium]